MEMPRPSEQHKKLSALAGTWVGEEKMHPSPWDPAGGTATARLQSRLDLDGFFVISDYVQERGGQVTYRGHGVYGWDPGEKTYLMYWFDSMGFPLGGPARGTWDGKKLAFQNRTPMGHGRYIYTFEADGRYTFRLENSQDGKQWTSFMDGTYTRK